MKAYSVEVKSMKAIAIDVYEMALEFGREDVGAFKPGQFVNLSIEGFYLRRPISICDIRDGQLILVFKILGQGTAVLAKLEAGAKVDLLAPLGNGFDIQASNKPVLIGGGVGVPPLYYLAKALQNHGMNPVVALGFQSKDDVFYEEEFKQLGLDVYITTVDGSYGEEGLVTSLFDKVIPEIDYIYSCGPIPMLRAIHQLNLAAGQYSFEERMGCGFGACMGCSWPVRGGGYKRVCKEGPIFYAEEILW